MRVTFEVDMKMNEKEWELKLKEMLLSEVKVLKVLNVNDKRKKVKVDENTDIFVELLKEHEEELLSKEENSESVLVSKEEAKKTAKKEEMEAKKTAKKEEMEAKKAAKKEAKKEEMEAKKAAKKQEMEAKKAAKKETKKQEMEAKKQEKKLAKKAEKITSVVESNESNTDEEEDECIKMMYEGKEFIKSIKTNVIYNMDEEVVGKFNEKTKKIEFDEEFQEEEYA
jgi:hypothetical protein